MDAIFTSLEDYSKRNPDTGIMQSCGDSAGTAISERRS